MQETGNNQSSQKELQDIDLISSSFSIDCSLSYNISIRACSNGYYLCAYNPNTEECVAIKTTKSLDSEALLTLNYNKVYVSKQSTFSLIPNALCDENLLSSFLLTEKHRIRINTNDCGNNTTLIFDTKRFPSISQAYDCVHPLTNVIHLANSINSQNICMVEQDGENINIIIKQNNKLILANSFSYHCTEDAAYYILAIYQQLNLDIYSHQTYLSGKSQDISNTKAFISEYINLVNIIATPKNNIWCNNFPTELYPMFASQLTTTI